MTASNANFFRITITSKSNCRRKWRKLRAAERNFNILLDDSVEPDGRITQIHTPYSQCKSTNFPYPGFRNSWYCVNKCRSTPRLSHNLVHRMQRDIPGSNDSAFTFAPSRNELPRHLDVSRIAMPCVLSSLLIS
jgi:hypothetical protein